ncbi:ShlB/FhaC/HecB family hemolysin secretion/activation protein [Herbaspirillum chlorophenolicum]|uniref:ShlB/FhaC/HecB family hemolysin secretion/activation protein n=1 Tax=Herbaspirillum chlorophenolicum TaxID=211589 RepID=UPI001E437B4A|nr:ShlB/FhaC/HecB family hemolysin secretion/activation protein [Herbaspirillum chlorophenolicum]
MNETNQHHAKPPPKVLSVILLAFPMLLAINPLYAQTPDIEAQHRVQQEADALQQREQLQRQTEERQRLQQQPEVNLQSQESVPPDDRFLPQEAPCFPINELHLDLPTQISPNQQRLGASKFPQDPFAFLQQALNTYHGRCIGYKGINLISQRLSAMLLAKGYSTTRIGVPEQKLSGGALTLVLIPGVIRSIRFATADISGSWKTAFPARPGDLLNLRDLEQGLEQMKRISSQDIDMQIIPGEHPGESDIVINLTRTKPWRLSVTLDDSGAKGTGQLQAGTNLAIDNPLGLNDSFNIGLNTDADRKGRQRGTTGNQISYAIPYGYWTFGIAGSSYQYHQEIAGLFQTFTSSGQSKNLEAKITYLFQRDQQKKNSVQFKVGKRWNRAYIDNTELNNQRRNTTFAELAWLHRHHLGNAQLDLVLANRWGVGWFNGDADSPLRQSGGPTFRYTLQTIDATLLMPFKIANQPFTYIGTLRGQTTQSALYATEQFVIGNRYTVRGFDGDLNLAAERGFFVRNEVDMPLGKSRHSIYAGLDTGKVYGPNVQYLLGDKLAGTALGMRGNVSGLSYDMFIAWALYKPQNFKTSSQTVGFTLLYRY